MDTFFLMFQFSLLLQVESLFHWCHGDVYW
jgi:hypothetical protein